VVWALFVYWRKKEWCLLAAHYYLNVTRILNVISQQAPDALLGPGSMKLNACNGVDHAIQEVDSASAPS